jgi:hypothetical protein
MEKKIISYERKVVHGTGTSLGYDHVEMKTIVEVSACTPEEHKQTRKELMSFRPSQGNILYTFRFLHVDADSFMAEIDYQLIDELEAVGYSF